MPPRISLGAELLALSIDPVDGGLAAGSHSRLRRALAFASEPPLGRRRAYRDARRELQAAGIAGRRRPFGRIRLRDPAAADRLLRRLGSATSQERSMSARDRELLVLLSWTGALRGRLPRVKCGLLRGVVKRLVSGRERPPAIARLMVFLRDWSAVEPVTEVTARLTPIPTPARGRSHGSGDAMGSRGAVLRPRELLT